MTLHSHAVDATYAKAIIPVVSPGENGWRYTVDGPMFVDTFLDTPKAFDCRFFHLSKCGRLSFLPPQHDRYSWDGCTAVPDGGLDAGSGLPKTVCASLVHDAVYQFSGRIADVWRCSRYSVLRWADHAFWRVMLNWDVPALRRETYYRGVRVFGYAFNRLSAAARKLSGKKDTCVSCARPDCL